MCEVGIIAIAIGYIYILDGIIAIAVGYCNRGSLRK